jgi:hypothetical protein
MRTSSVAGPVHSEATDLSGALLGASVECAASNDVEARDRKRLERKMKNREAAARSNLRRKQRDDALKKAVAEGRVRVVDLRATEDTLRAENVRLRELLGVGFACGGGTEQQRQRV